MPIGTRLKMFEQKKGGKGEAEQVCTDSLDMWAKRTRDYSNVVKLAQHVLANPATQAPSERMFSRVGLIANKRRSWKQLGSGREMEEGVRRWLLKILRSR